MHKTTKVHFSLLSEIDEWKFLSVLCALYLLKISAYHALYVKFEIHIRGWAHFSAIFHTLIEIEFPNEL